MRPGRAGTLLFTTGGGAINPYPMLATTTSPRRPAELGGQPPTYSLATEGIYAANVAINLMIGSQPPEGCPAPLARARSPSTTGPSTPVATRRNISSAPEDSTPTTGGHRYVPPPAGNRPPSFPGAS
ncbi:hypothetical protein GCM10018966_096680 [Streptomyces yanii]